MSIVLNEHYSAEESIHSRTLGKKPSETLRRVARYYIDEFGYSKKEVRDKLDTFLLQCEPTASIPKWSNMLDFATEWAVKHKAIQIESIVVTVPEIAKIDALRGSQIRRLAFTLLCLSKYWNAANSQNDYWVNSSGSNIMSFANINTSIKRQCAMYASLKDEGMIQFSKKVDNTNVKVCFAEYGEPAMVITDLRNLGYQYLKYHGGAYFECANCGITVKADNPNKGRKQKYCKDCAIEIKTKQSVNAVMRGRDTSASTNNTPKTYTVYMHQAPNGKRYVGFTSTPLCLRWQNGTGYIDNKKFYSDILKFGWDNIKHYKIASTDNERSAREIESFYIQYFKTHLDKHGYNKISGYLVYEFDESIAKSYVIKEVDALGNETI